MVTAHAYADALVEQAPLADRVLAVTTDSQGTVTWCSPAFERLLGHPSAALLGREVPAWLFDADEVGRRSSAAGVPFGPALFLVDPRNFGRRNVRVDLGPDDRRRGRESAASRPSACDWTLVSRDGRRAVVSVSVRPLHDHRGRGVGYLAVGVDVTEERRTRRLLAEALKREQSASRRLEELDRMRTEFVETAGHELRTPLTSIGGYLDLLEAHLDGSPQSRSLLERVRRNTSRMQHLADELLYLATPGAPCPGADRVEDLGRVLEAAAEVLEPLARRRGSTLHLEGSDRPVLVRGEVHHLERVLVHLVDNALKFADAGADVVCRVDVRDDEAVLEVCDTGPGIAADELDQVFDRFYRGATAVRDGVPGAGLGLSVVRTLVQRLGGTVSLHPNVPRGTVARVQLPRVVKEAGDDD